MKTLLSCILLLALSRAGAAPVEMNSTLDGLGYLPDAARKAPTLPMGSTRAKVSKAGSFSQRDEKQAGFTVGMDAFAWAGTLQADGNEMRWRLFAPTVTGNVRCPLVVFLHGLGEAGADNTAQFKHDEFLVFAQPAIQRACPAYVLAPQHARGESWGGPVVEQPRFQLRMLVALIDQLRVKFPVDLSRIYIVGLSSGAGGVIDAVTLYPDVFAAGVAISNTHGSPYMIAERRRKPSPVWFFINDGESQPILDNAKTLPDAMARWGSDIRLTVADKRAGHAAWQWSFFHPDLLPWLFRQQLSVRPSYFEAADRARK
ncbi:hypothetical protein KBB96_09290 [Luteolibacter ambystomatis]|uniref:Poly(3-hydroxybutyrate) depolymerase n=1 Tax=Luteolibacter ambystomatis TaxID=2824561 RepID=A0A975J325_9BACT|nr:PHB depolymerase family esterase [Luteolibacter ambystomatis]QUE53072.1 hypothetical protein KBB96_09290 [Luteolibacter ambystomatis]